MTFLLWQSRAGRFPISCRTKVVAVVRKQTLTLTFQINRKTNVTYLTDKRETSVKRYAKLGGLVYVVIIILGISSEFFFWENLIVAGNDTTTVQQQQKLLSNYLFLPGLIAETSLAFCLLVKGVNVDKWTVKYALLS